MQHIDRCMSTERLKKVITYRLPDRNSIPSMAKIFLITITSKPVRGPRSHQTNKYWELIPEHKRPKHEANRPSSVVEIKDLHAGFIRQRNNLTLLLNIRRGYECMEFYLHAPYVFIAWFLKQRDDVYLL
jgi:hypothetical protein